MFYIINYNNIYKNIFLKLNRMAMEIKVKYDIKREYNSYRASDFTYFIKFRVEIMFSLLLFMFF